MSYEGGGGGDASTWSTFPATQNVLVTGYNLDVDTISGLNGLMVSLSAVDVDGTNFLTLDSNIVGGPPTNWAGYPATTNVDMQTFNLFSTSGDLTNTFTLGDASSHSTLSVQGNLLLKAGIDAGTLTLNNNDESTIVLDDSGNIELNAYATSYLKVSTHGATGTTGQYLGSDGSGNVTWSTPLLGFVYAGITPDLTDVSWIPQPDGTYIYDYTIPGVTLNSDANVQVTTINGDAETAQACWVVTIIPNSPAGTSGSLRIVVASNPNINPAKTYYLSILVLSVGTAPT